MTFRIKRIQNIKMILNFTYPKGYYIHSIFLIIRVSNLQLTGAVSKISNFKKVLGWKTWNIFTSAFYFESTICHRLRSSSQYSLCYVEFRVCIQYIQLLNLPSPSFTSETSKLGLHLSIHRSSSAPSRIIIFPKFSEWWYIANGCSGSWT